MIGTAFTFPDDCLYLSSGQDTLYAVDYDLRSAVCRFHLNVWDRVREDRAAFPLNELVCLPIAINRAWQNPIKPIFYFRKQRDNFRRWFARYDRVFFNGRATDSIVPLPREGLVSGTMVEDGRVLADALLQQAKFEGSIFDSETTEQLKVLFEDWTWIAANCKRRVVRTLGGWIFASKAEAAHFKLAKSD